MMNFYIRLIISLSSSIEISRLPFSSYDVDQRHDRSEWWSSDEKYRSAESCTTALALAASGEQTLSKMTRALSLAQAKACALALPLTQRTLSKMTQSLA